MVIFISDVHLGLFSREENFIRENKLLAFFEKIVDKCEVLYIVGDLFDYWFEYKYVTPKYFYRTLAKLKELRMKGVKIEYLMGNHDFGHKDFFEKELDIPIHRDDITAEIQGKKFYISHGDGKNNKDTGYKILKKVLRNPLAQWLYNKLHPDFGIWLASSSSKKSRDYTGNKNWGENDGMAEFAKSKIEEGFDYVIVGHRHKAETIKINNGLFVDLGDWLKADPTFGVMSDGKFELVTYNNYFR